MKLEEMSDKEQRLSDVQYRIVINTFRREGLKYAYGYMAALWENGLLADEHKDYLKKFFTEQSE